MALQQQQEEAHDKGQASKAGNKSEIPVGIKTPPYTYHDQFQSLIDALLDCSGKGSCPVDFITAVNTLGSSLLVAPFSSFSPTTTTSFHPTLASANGTGIGGLAGTPLHPLALGNVYTITQMLGQHEVLKGVQVIGVGGVADKEGYRRMRRVGARAVGVGTALGRKGVAVFEEIGAVKVEEQGEEGKE